MLICRLNIFINVEASPHRCSNGEHCPVDVHVNEYEFGEFCHFVEYQFINKEVEDASQILRGWCIGAEKYTNAYKKFRVIRYFITEFSVSFRRFVPGGERDKSSLPTLVP